MRLAIGIGCRAGASGEAVARLVRQALATVEAAPPPSWPGLSRPSTSRGDACIPDDPETAVARDGVDARDKPGHDGNGRDESVVLWAPDFLDNPALAQAAAALGLPLHRCDAAALRAVASGVVSHSPRVFALHAVGSVAEAAALAGAGRGARVIVPKVSADGVSVAAARGSH